MAESHYENQEPAAAGRESFWLGRPIWANPFIGAAARIWKTGWVNGQAEFALCVGEASLTASGHELTRLLERHRPADLGVRPGRGGRSRFRGRSEASVETPTYTLTAPGDETSGDELTSGI